jgi:molecular chaperone DnaK (HSP70)
MTRFAVGIDLGTTHCALAFAELDADGAASVEHAAAGAAEVWSSVGQVGTEGEGATTSEPGVTAGAPASDPPPESSPPQPTRPRSLEDLDPEVMAVPQLVARGQVEARTLLPSFLYVAHQSEGAQALPWDAERRFVVGQYARTRGVDVPGRVIASAKSWLSHPTVDRRAGFLPIGGAEDVEKISPVEASWRYLEHLAEAFDARFGGGESALAKQDVVIAVPASFDASARELTVEAAMAAGIEKLTLLEEPQAALYAWTRAIGDAWRKQVRPGDVVLVVDVGGGTTDFSAIAAVEREGALELVRVAVGDHILLGGDNMDLALAHFVRHKLESEGKVLDRTQQASLVHACRGAKERLFWDMTLESAPIAIALRGSALLGATLRTEVTRDEVTRAVVDGFFPIVAADARPVTRARIGLTELGLPYASDAAVTRHLAAFLSRQAGALAKLEGMPPKSGRPARLLHPTAVLFNGGVMKAEKLRARLVDTLNVWLGSDGAEPVRVLEGADLDLAVARGACAYALVRRGKGLRIRGGTARAYYVGIESAVPAVPGIEPPVSAICVAPFGMEEGTEAKLPPHEFGVVVGEPVSFRFYGSSVRRDDAAGVVLEDCKRDELEELPPMELTLPADGRHDGEVVPVRLRSQVTEMGTLLLEAEPIRPLREGERWRVELSVRGADDDGDEGAAEEAETPDEAVD